MRAPANAPLIRRSAPWIGGTLLLILTALMLLVLTGGAQTGPSTAPKAGGNDITSGAEDARVVLVEYSDFQCEVCAVYAKALSPLRAQYADAALFVFRFFPLEYHENALPSAQAAYAAFLQGKFWQMHDLLYEHQQEWSNAAEPYPLFETYASGLDLDAGRFRQDYDSQATKDFITKQKAEGDAAGVSHTPWFVLNDSVVTPLNPDELRIALGQAVLRARSATTVGE